MITCEECQTALPEVSFRLHRSGKRWRICVSCAQSRITKRMSPEQIELVRRLFLEGQRDYDALGALIGFSPAAVWNQCKDLIHTRVRRIPIGQRPNIFTDPSSDWLATAISHRAIWHDPMEVLGWE